MMRRLLRGLGLVAVLLLLVGSAPLAAEEAEPAGPINSLRVYGKALEYADFPYQNYWDPYDLTAAAAPPKDFVQFNPAFIHEFFDPLGRYIKCGEDAAEKVHARMWYQPKYREPMGATHPEVRDPVYWPDIVFEYTYTMLNDDTLNPTTCAPCETQLVFPMVGGVAPGFPNEQVGLEGYDVNNDGNDEVLKLEEVRGEETIVVSPKSTSGAIRLHQGDVIEFLDYAVKVIDEPTTEELKVEVAIYYTGWRHNRWDFIGQTSLWLHDKAAVDARHGPVRPFSSPEIWRVPTPVIRPFWIEATYVGTDFVEIKPFRILTAGETFFVDGAEYDVAKIFTENGKFKYLTLRNPLPKGAGDLFIYDISVYKRLMPANTSLPMLPPFNMVHDEIDDTNIPDYVQGDPNKEVCPDCQFPDNPGAPKLHPSYDTILERLLEDTPPYDGAAGDPMSYIAWIKQTKEGRFDTNLTEEKWREICEEEGQPCDEVWQWINIETRPWDYTEFILPMRPDVTDPADEDGDYILVGSWITQEGARLKFAYDAAVGPIHSADIYVNDAEYNMEFRGVDANSLRVYGRCDFNAAFPYTLFDGPFNIGNANVEKPEKDFIVHNPALLNHWDPDNELYSNIVADEDAHEKVHLRTWYVPKYDEPAGMTDPEVPDPVSNDEINGMGDIVNEYTYMFLDDASQDPTHGSYDRTQMVFPMAGLGGQVGLDRYDVNGDGTDEIMSVERILDEDFPFTVCEEPTTMGEIIVSPEPVDAGNMQLNVGDRLEFFDYMIELVDTSSAETKALFDVWYTGRGYDDPFYVGSVDLFSGPFGVVPNTAIVDAGNPASLYTASYWDHPLDDIAEELEAVDKPFAFLVDHVSTNYVTLKPFRVLTTGETFFVDGAEYDVAAIGVVPGDTMSEAHGQPLCELKYITLRNPLPKCEEGDCDDLFIRTLSVDKRRFPPQTPLPVLPPFNHMHDMVDDVNIPDYISGKPDWQYDDNPAPQLRSSYNTILKRLVPDQGRLIFWWLAEEKEERFDTSLTEEKWKFTDAGDEVWKWINIETLPWDFTEFVLPEIPEAPGLEGMGYIGDYILVSSFVTEDTVRAKFSYDATDGTGLYVNSDLCEPARVTSLSSNSPVPQWHDVELNATVENADSFMWDFGDLTGCTGGDTLSPTCSGDVPGEYEVCLTVENECATHTVCTDVVVEMCLGDFDPDAFRNLDDIMLMLPAWNTDCGDPDYDDMFDFDGDCHIGLFDIMQVVAVWNTPCP